MNATEEHMASIQKKLADWTTFVSELKIPPELVTAVCTGRHELACNAKVRPMSAEEVKTLYELIGGLLETNQALREHASLMARATAQVYENLRGVARGLTRLGQFAEFLPIDEGEEE